MLLPSSLSSAANADQTTWELLTPFPAGNFETRNLEQFATEIASATENRLTIVVLPAQPQFGSAAIRRAVETGRAPAGEFMLADAGYEHAVFAVDTVPFLAGSYAEAQALWAASRPVLQPQIEAGGLHLAFVVPHPPRGLYVNRDLWAMSDFRGLRLRDDAPMVATLAPLLAMQPVPAGSPPAAPAEQFRSGRIDAMIADVPTGATGQFWSFVGSFFDLRIALPKSALVFNRAAYDRLDAELQRALLNGAVAASNRGWQASSAAHNSGMDVLRSNGMTVAILPAEMTDRLHTIGETLAADWAKRAGPDGERVLAGYRAGRPSR